MDPLCHTLTGAALAEAGLKHRTRFASGALLIGANLPDIDVVSAGISTVESLSFRRGWTHGILAMVLLPMVLTAALMAWDRLAGRLRASPPDRSVRFTPLVIVSAVAVASHYLLDFLNVYGIRLLMPFSDVWLYGDALFIVDPWLWLALGIGLIMSRRRTVRMRPLPEHPARRALQAASAYIAIMLLANVAARQIVGAALSSGPAPRRMMVAPVLADPFRRDVVLDWGDRYEVARFDWVPVPKLTRLGRTVETRARIEEAALATATKQGQLFLAWARFPYYRVEGSGTTTTVEIADLRYAIDSRGAWAAVTVDLGAPP